MTSAVFDPNNVNGAASYVYDAVGNRTQKTSTIPGFPGGLTNYNANDQISTDTYDNNGNTTASNGLGYVYDFENHVIQAGAGVTMVYDGDGNRVKKTVAGVTTTYLVDTQNPTGYAQVASESITGNTTQPYDTARVYVYGLERISQQRSYVANNQGQTQTSYYVYDGHGSTRALTDPNGAVTDTYDYDAFGNLLHSTGTTANEFLFAGEQFDSDLNLYYNRARYLNVSTGRFWSMDTFEGNNSDPPSLHKYLYASGDPADLIDPSGRDVVEFLVAVALVVSVVASIGGDNAPRIIGSIKQDVLKTDFSEQFTTAAIKHAKEVGASRFGQLSNLRDSVCRFLSAAFSPRKCELGCLAWQNWMIYEWFPTARAINSPTWNNITVSQVYSLDFPLFIHNFARARFPIAPLILDPWRDYEHPVWEESDYLRIQGAQINDGSFSLN